MSTIDQLTSQVLQNPAGAATSGLSVVIRVFAFILIVLYILFAIRVWVQVGRLTKWLMLLQGHRFEMWALVHLILAVAGLVLALFLLLL